MDFPRNVGTIAASEEMTMTRRPRRNHSPAFKVRGGSENDLGDRFPDDRVAVAAIKGERTLIELAQDFDVHLLPAGVCGQTPRGQPDQAVVGSVTRRGDRGVRGSPEG